MSLKDRIKGALIESDPVPAKTSVKVVSPVPDTIQVSAGTEQSDPKPLESAGGFFYAHLHDATDFDRTTAGQNLQKAMLPLVALKIDEATKWKAAAAQAGITIADISAAFESIKATLESEKQIFERASQHAKENEIDKRTKKIEENKAQIESLQKEIVELTSQAGEAQRKIDSSRAEFDGAFSTRKTELDQQLARFSALLQ